MKGQRNAAKSILLGRPAQYIFDVTSEVRVLFSDRRRLNTRPTQVIGRGARALSSTPIIFYIDGGDRHCHYCHTETECRHWAFNKRWIGLTIENRVRKTRFRWTIQAQNRRFVSLDCVLDNISYTHLSALYPGFYHTLFLSVGFTVCIWRTGYTKSAAKKVK